MTAPVFSPTHEIAELRGVEIPDATAVRRELDVRSAWLVHRIKLRTIDGHRSQSELRELAAWAVMRRLLDEAYPVEVGDTTPPPPAGGET